MHRERSMEQLDEKLATRIDGERSTEPGWQYSLRSLLILTAVVSACLAVGVHFAGVIFVIVAIGLSQAAFLVATDWLIRPANRRALAFVTAAFWIVLGSGLATLGGSQIYGAIGAEDSAASWPLGWGLIASGIFCYYVASKRWRRLTCDRA